MAESFYALHDFDVDLKRHGAREIPVAAAEDYNSKGYGIFWTPNSFHGERKAKNLARIIFWFVDIDLGEKEKILNRILTALLLPSLVVETKKGYHAYYRAVDPNPANFQMVQRGLIEKFNGDPACKDVSRLLRVPGFNHWKDPANPFPVRKISECAAVYTEAKMMFCFPAARPKIKKISYTGDKADFLDEKNWDRIFGLNRIGTGGRNNELSRIAFWLRDEGFSRDIVSNTLHRMNSKLPEPLDQGEIESIVKGKF